ncbi:Solute carrier family 35 member F2 [Aphelenchoides bicaudatus]|nr:Solute carrier family 35 member F2 [Aphelenchoides bicaudatus]
MAEPKKRESSKQAETLQMMPVQQQQIQNDDSSSEDSSSELHCLPCYENRTVRRTLRAVLLGQVMSLCLCGTGIGSELLARNKFNAPASQNFLNYFLLFFVYGLMVVCRSGDRNMLNVLKDRGWKYLILAFVDVQANYLIVYAYQYTNLTSIQILDCSVIPTVMVLSYLFLSVRYLISHLVGVSVCLVGIGLIIYADVVSGKGAEGGQERLIGDVLCLAAAFLYGIANVTEEFLVKQYDRFEYLGMVGLFGSIITCLQVSIFERSALVNYSWSVSSLLEYGLFTACMFSFYSLVSMVMSQTSALNVQLGSVELRFLQLTGRHIHIRVLFQLSILAEFRRETKERSRAEANFISKILCFCCPCVTCIECRPRASYSVRDAQRTPSVSLETPPSSASTPSAG